MYNYLFFMPNVSVCCVTGGIPHLF